MSLFALPPEKLLHFIWQGSRFDIRDLYTRCGKKIYILHPGTLNHDQGPDFLGAKLKIDGVEWYGHVELHVEGQDWYRHQHQTDSQYNSCILHVVHTASREAPILENGIELPELVIGNRVDAGMYARYHLLQLSQETIPCENQIKDIDPIRIRNWLDRLSIERMEEKAGRFQQKLTDAVYDWEQVLWEEIAGFLAGPVNQHAFKDLAIRIPAKVMTRVSRSTTYLESLLFGAAGMLPGSGDEYIETLRENWTFLQEKHKIKPFQEQIRFLRMRPQAFPTLRISQIATLWYELGSLIFLLESDGIDRFLNMEIPTSDYWNTRYRFGEETKARAKKLGQSQKAILIVNVLLPMGWLYQIAHGRENPFDWMEKILMKLPAENNKHTRVFTDLGLVNTRALQSQAMIQLHKQYCLQRRCLDCHLGQHLLDRDQTTSAQSGSSVLH